MTQQLDGARERTSAEETAWDSLRERVTISLRPIGAPTALGFFGLAAATFVLSGLQLSWIPVTDGRNVAYVLVGFAFVAQMVASVFSFLARDGAAGTAMGVLALSWLVVGLVLLTAPPGSTSDALGMFLLFTAAAMALTGLTTALGKLVPAAVFVTASVRFALVAIYELTMDGAWKDAAGVVGLVLFALAMYAAWAVQFEDALGKSVLPLGRHRKGKRAVTGSLLEQFKELSTEPGVRAQL